MHVNTPNLQITNLSLISNNQCAENERKLNTELINNLNQINSHPQQKLNGKIKGREMQTQGQHSMCYRRGNRNPRRKTTPPPLKR